MKNTHNYAVKLTWTGNKGTGTSGYRAYSRDYSIEIAGKPTLAGSSDAAFLGDASRHNPEDMFVASVASCHMLWYLHLASNAGIIVSRYEDQTTAEMVTHPNGSGEFKSVTLEPRVTIEDPAHKDKAAELHREVGALCFIARSIKTPIHHRPVILVAGEND